MVQQTLFKKLTRRTKAVRGRFLLEGCGQHNVHTRSTSNFSSPLLFNKARSITLGPSKGTISEFPSSNSFGIFFNEFKKQKKGYPQLESIRPKNLYETALNGNTIPQSSIKSFISFLTFIKVAIFNVSSNTREFPLE